MKNFKARKNGDLKMFINVGSTDDPSYVDFTKVLMVTPIVDRDFRSRMIFDLDLNIMSKLTVEEIMKRFYDKFNYQAPLRVKIED